MIEPVVVRVLAELERRGETLATAESLTGGLLGELITEVPGASRSYLGGVITYATRLKSELAGVDESTLEAVGPVAAGTAEEMARGVAARCAATWAIATTGVAGPDPQDGHPVGQVFVAIAHATGTPARVVELALVGDRAAIRWQAAQSALELLAETLGMKVGPIGVQLIEEA